MWSWGVFLLHYLSDPCLNFPSSYWAMWYCFPIFKKKLKELSCLGNILVIIIHLLVRNIFKITDHMLSSIFSTSSRGFSWKHYVEKLCSFYGGRIKSLVALIPFIVNKFEWISFYFIGIFLYCQSIRKILLKFCQLSLLIHIILLTLVFDIEKSWQKFYWELTFGFKK